MRKTKFEKIKEILKVCENVNESDLNFILGYASGIAIKSESIKRKK